MCVNKKRPRVSAAEAARDAFLAEVDAHVHILPHHKPIIKAAIRAVPASALGETTQSARDALADIELIYPRVVPRVFDSDDIASLGGFQLTVRLWTIMKGWPIDTEFEAQLERPDGTIFGTGEHSDCTGAVLPFDPLFINDWLFTALHATGIEVPFRAYQGIYNGARCTLTEPEWGYVVEHGLGEPDAGDGGDGLDFDETTPFETIDIAAERPEGLRAVHLAPILAEWRALIATPVGKAQFRAICAARAPPPPMTGPASQ